MKGITWRAAVIDATLTARLNGQCTAISKGTDTLNIADYFWSCQHIVSIVIYNSLILSVSNNQPIVFRCADSHSSSLSAFDRFLP